MKKRKPPRRIYTVKAYVLATSPGDAVRKARREGFCEAYFEQGPTQMIIESLAEAEKKARVGFGKEKGAGSK